MMSDASETPTRSGTISIVNVASSPTVLRSSRTHPSRDVAVTSTNIGASRTCAYHRPPSCHIRARTDSLTVAECMTPSLSPLGGTRLEEHPAMPEGVGRGVQAAGRRRCELADDDRACRDGSRMMRVDVVDGDQDAVHDPWHVQPSLR